MSVRTWLVAEVGRAPRAYGAALVVLAASLAYANTLDVPFHFDDEHAIVENPYLRDLSLIPSYFTRPDMFSALPGHAMYRPVLLVTFALNYSWGGVHPLPWRLTAIALHVLCAVGVYLTFLVASRQLRSRPARAGTAGALVAALFFALHPVLTETVDYASARSSLLAALFTLWAFLAHRRAAAERRPRPRLALLALSLLLFALALLSKEIAIVFPALLLWAAVLERRGGWAVVPSLVVAVVYLWARDLLLGAAVIDFGARAEQLATADPGSGGARLVSHNLYTQARVVAGYVLLLLAPQGLCVHRHVRVSATPWEPGVIAGALVIAGLLALAWRLRRRAPVASLGIVWFLVALAPTSSIVPLNQVMNEHRLYAAGIGAAFAVGSLLMPLLRRPRAWAGVGLGAGLLLALTLQRNEDWRDPLRLWESAVRVSPEHDASWNALGVELRRRGRFDESIRAFDAARERNPQAWAPVFNLGTVHLERGRREARYEDFRKAEEWLEKSLAVRPGSERSRWFLAETWHAMGRVEKAESAFRELSGLSPLLFEMTRYPLARIAIDRGRLAEAEALYGEALAAARDPVAAELGLAEVALLDGNRVLAVARAKGAMTARPWSPLPHLFLARVHRGTVLAAHHLFEAERRGYRPTPEERRSLLDRRP